MSWDMAVIVMMLASFVGMCATFGYLLHINEILRRHLDAALAQQAEDRARLTLLQNERKW